MSLSFLTLDAYKGKIIWITGASSGLGAALGHEMAMKGAQVILSARRSDQLVTVKNRIMNDRNDIPVPYILSLDVTDLTAQKKAVSEVLEKFKISRNTLTNWVKKGLIKVYIL